ncbi:MAG TPA: PAS domain S-box protein [Nitrospirota bacterium]|nr:PAS domain S-box protein [Nitrospirota bacterium]
MQQGLEYRKHTVIILVACTITIVVLSVTGGFLAARSLGSGLLLALVLALCIPVVVYLLYQKALYPSYRKLEDANLELHLKQEELLDTKDDLFVKFLGIYDVNYAANSPRLFKERLMDVADITARVMEADACCIFLHDGRKDDLILSATKGTPEEGIGRVRIPLGEGMEGWVGRRLEPLMLKEFRSDARYRSTPGLTLDDFQSVYCLPLYVYSNGALVGVMEVLYRKARVFSDEEINFFTTLSGILSTTIQNEQMQAELRKMNMELEQWVAEKTEELRASEERYRTLVENACESIFLLAGEGDIVFANEQATRLAGYEKYELIHKNLFELFIDPTEPRKIMDEVKEGKSARKQGSLRQADGTRVPVEVNAVGLTLMGKWFVQAVVRDSSSHAELEQVLQDKERDIKMLKEQLQRLQG